MDKNMDESIKGRILIIDDEEHIREILGETLKPLASALFMAASAESAREIVQEENLDIVLCDVQMPGQNGLEFLKEVKREHPSVRFIMITAHGSLDTAVRALRYGASDFLTKPFENPEVRQIVSRLLAEKNSVLEPGLVPPEEKGRDGIIGQSPIFIACLEQALKAAKNDTTVLVCGESGTGKEVLARAIHRHSQRAEGPFIAVNCGAIPENLMESEFFGHEKGAFTGAVSSKPGKFELANGGTLFLDEIGEMPLSMQVKLLRALQERSIDPVGSVRPRKVDFRLIAATNRNLMQEVRNGAFREDLYYRLNIIPCELPPLRSRGNDIQLLADYFLAYFNERYGCAYVFSDSDRAQLARHRWPGNIRELGNLIERAVVLGSEGKLHFSFDVAADAETTAATQEGGIRESRQSAEKDVILKALDKNRWNKTQTAESLGISRRSLLYKIKEYGLA